MIFLTVLKIIGIVLASIVGVALLLVLLVLFAPVRYKITGNGADENIKAGGKASWLFGLLSAKATYFEKNLEYKIYLIGIPLKKGGIGKDFKKEDEDILESVENTANEKESDKQVEEAKKNKAKEEEPAEDDFDLEIEMINLEQDISKYRPFKRKQEKPVEVENDIDTVFDAIENYVNNLTDRYNRLKRKVSQFKIVLTSNTAKRAFKVVKINILSIINHIKPKKISGNVNFGLEDPSKTAIIYGTIDIFAEYLSKGKLVLVPDFTKKVLDLDVAIIGRLFAGYVIITGFKVIFNRDVKRVVKVLRRII